MKEGEGLIDTSEQPEVVGGQIGHVISNYLINNNKVTSAGHPMRSLLHLGCVQ